MVGSNDEDMSRMLKAMIRKDTLGDAKVMMNGEDITSIDSVTLSETVSYMKAHEFTLFEKLDAFENIRIFGNLNQRTKLDKMLVTCEQFFKRNRLVEKMGPSERSMLQILVSVISQEKKIVVLDEPALFFDLRKKIFFL